MKTVGDSSRSAPARGAGRPLAPRHRRAKNAGMGVPTSHVEDGAPPVAPTPGLPAARRVPPRWMPVVGLDGGAAAALRGESPRAVSAGGVDLVLVRTSRGL